MAVDPNTHDRFVLRQRIRPVLNQYEISLPGEDGEPAQPVCFVEQARFKFKEDIRFYTDDTKQVDAHAPEGASAVRPARPLRRHRRARRQDRRDPEGLRREPAALDVPALQRERRGGRARARAEHARRAAAPRGRLHPVRAATTWTGCRFPTTSSSSATAT